MKPKDILLQKQSTTAETADFNEAKKQFLSLIAKTEKVLLKIKEGSSQHRRLAAYKLAVSLLEEKLMDN